MAGMQDIIAMMAQRGGGGTPQQGGGGNPIEELMRLVQARPAQLPPGSSPVSPGRAQRTWEPRNMRQRSDQGAVPAERMPDTEKALQTVQESMGAQTRSKSEKPTTIEDQVVSIVDELSAGSSEYVPDAERLLRILEENGESEDLQDMLKEALSQYDTD